MPDEPYRDDIHLRTVLNNLRERILLHGLEGTTPDPEESICVHLAVCEMFDRWYTEFYLTDD